MKVVVGVAGKGVAQFEAVTEIFGHRPQAADGEVIDMVRGVGYLLEARRNDGQG